MEIQELKLRKNREETTRRSNIYRWGFLKLQGKGEADGRRGKRHCSTSYPVRRKRGERSNSEETGGKNRETITSGERKPREKKTFTVDFGGGKGRN